MKDEVKRKFEERFSEHGGCRLVMDGSLFRKLSLEENLKLEGTF